MSGKQEKIDINSVSQVKNKMKRRQIFAMLKKKKKEQQKKGRKKRQLERKELGDKAPPVKAPRTIENTRESDETMVSKDDTEVLEDEATDEFADYFVSETTPAICITTNEKPNPRGWGFARELTKIIPGARYFKRNHYELRKIIQYCNERKLTDVLVVNEDRDEVNGLIHCHLPRGPTAYYKVSSVKFPKEIYKPGKLTTHKPELILNNFNTRLGHTIGRMFACLFPQQPNFKGRRVVTFHNQRDFIFFRHHRYIFDLEDERNDGKPDAHLQEIGPSFTLKLQSLQHGLFDPKFGEFIWTHKTEMDTTRRRFFL